MLRELAAAGLEELAVSRPLVEARLGNQRAPDRPFGRAVPAAVAHHLRHFRRGAVHRRHERLAAARETISTDPEAPIFRRADIIMVADLYEVVPRLIARGKGENTIVDKPAVLRARFPIASICRTASRASTASNRGARECIFPFRTALRFACAVFPCLRTSCARHFSPSGLHLCKHLLPKIPEMTYTPSFLD